MKNLEKGTNKTNDTAKEKEKKKRAKTNLRLLIAAAFTISFIVIFVMSAAQMAIPIQPTMSFNDFMTKLDSGEVAKITFIQSKRCFNAELKDGTIETVIDPGDTTFRREMLESGVTVEIARMTMSEAMDTVIQYIPIFSLSFITIFMILRMTGDAGEGSALFRVYSAKECKKFDDVAGMSEIKEEVRFAVNQLQNTDKLKELGTRPCKGIILEGPPGTGKTLLARAIAGEANVPFIPTSGSSFVEMFVGLGSRRVRNLWKVAVRNAPCVVFIDEIDAVGRKRLGGVNGADMEAGQTLNELLSKMDGLGASDGILVIGATNRIQDLDPALLRPGRFDKHLYIGAPKNKKDRDEIIKLYASNKKFDETFDIDKISKLMFGLSGADIEQIMNESVMVSLQRGGKGIVSLDDVDKATMKHRASGVEIKHSSTEDIHITAIHEAGHAVMNQLLGRKVSKVSITPYSSGVGGMTIRDTDDIENKKLQTKTDIINDIKVLLAGRASEQIIFGDTSIGCSNDIERATSLAYDMLYKYAMSDTRILNPKVLKDEGVVALDNKEVIAEIDKVLQEYNKSVIDELKKHTDDIKALANRLEIEEDVYNYELDKAEIDESKEKFIGG